MEPTDLQKRLMIETGVFCDWEEDHESAHYNDGEWIIHATDNPSYHKIAVCKIHD